MRNKHGKLSQERSSSHGFWATHQENDSLPPSPPINVPKVTINTLLFGVCVCFPLHVSIIGQDICFIYAYFMSSAAWLLSFNYFITFLFHSSTANYAVSMHSFKDCFQITRVKKETQICLQGKWSRVRGPVFGFLKLFSLYYLKFFEINFFLI